MSISPIMNFLQVKFFTEERINSLFLCRSLNLLVREYPVGQKTELHEWITESWE